MDNTETRTPAQGDRVTDPATGVTVTADRSVHLPDGRLVVFGLDDDDQPQRVYLPAGR